MRTIGGTILLLLTSAAAQTPDASAQFEVASVKPAPPPDGRGMRVSMRGGPGTEDPGFFRCENCSLSGLVTDAFDILDHQLTGPDFMHNARFDISAKIPTGATKAQFREMLQNLLAERFKMTYHRDKKEMPILHLVVMKNGPKFKESKPAEPAADDDAPRQSGPMKKDANGFPILSRGTGFSMAIMNNRAALRTDGGTMEGLAANISNQLHQPVIDSTGLNGKYDIAMTWVPGDAPDNPGPTIFAAIQEQLGLKLEAKKGAVDMIIIDHMEKTPAEN